MTDWNQPDSLAALRPWLLIDPLTIFQATMLIFGRDPSHEITGRPSGYVPIATAMKQAIERGELSAIRSNNPLEGRAFGLDEDDKTSVRQADVRQWLNAINHNSAFFFLTNPDHWPNARGEVPSVTDKPLALRERGTLLRIIRALDVMVKLPPKGAASSVERQLQEIGFDSPKESTIRNLLAEARALEPDKNP